ncbi:MAG TPA: IS66 family transposase [Gemmataceae bacterium]
MPDDPDTLKAMIRELLAQLRANRHELDGVRLRLDQLLRRLYGPKSERTRSDQPTLFDDPAEPDADDPPAGPDPTPNGSSPRRGRPGRRRLPADLERTDVVHDLPDDQKTCPCCHEPRVVIGEQVSEQLDYHPAKLFVWRHVRLSYACPACLAQAIAPVPDGQPEPPALIVTAPKPPQPIDKGLPGPGLLAHVITSKYADHLPLHRQEAMLARQGVELSRSTLCDWMAAAADLLTPLYAWMVSEVLKSRVVQTDETRVPVQEPGQAKTESGRLWAYLGDRDHPHTVYDYTATKARDGPAAILKGYRGFLQADAANVFDGLYVPGSITEVACWAHGRRHFHEARDTDAARSAEAIARIGAFYVVERQAAETIERDRLEGDAADAVRRRLRQEQTVPLLDAFATWLEAQAKVVLPKSPMGQAIAYAQRHWQALRRFTEHGFLNIDNNASERALRAVAIGRKNWLFAGSDAGGRTAAVLYTLAQTCKRHRVDPFAYLQDVLARLPGLPAEQLPEFAPQTWAEAQRARVTPAADPA